MKTKANPAVALPSLSEVNDLGKPWRYEEDGLTVTRSAVWSPPGCHPVGCGLKLYTDKDGKLVKVEGDENHPVTQGRLCVRCLALKDYVYNAGRITKCMKRDPKFRGQADKWEEISYDEALDIFESEYNRITGQYGRESMIIFGGTGREGGTFTPYITGVFRTPTMCYTQSGYSCYVPRAAAAASTTGIIYPELDYSACQAKRYDDPDYQVPECVVLWGKEPLKSNPDGFFGHSVIDLMKRGTRLISVDPRVNWLASRADIHLPLRPGTDAALGMAMLRIIVDEDLYDHNFVENWCMDFDKFCDRLHDSEKGITPEQAAEICWLDVEDIYKAARMYAMAKPAGILWGLAVDQKTNGQQNAQCIIALTAITGNIDRPGGQLVQSFEELWASSDWGYSELDMEEYMSKMIGIDTYPLYCQMIKNAHCDMTLRTMETDDPFPIRMGFYMGNNALANTSAEPRRWEAAINRSCEFVATIDCFMTSSAQATCDLFIPLATVAEHDGTVFEEYAASPLINGVTNKAIEAPGDARSDIEFAYDLGRRLNPELFGKFNDIYEFINDFRFSNKYDVMQLREEVYVPQTNSYYKYETGGIRPDGKPGFSTSSGKIELYSYVYEQLGEDPLPYYMDPDFGPVNTPELMEDYPFVLTTGARTYAFFHSEHRNVPYLRELNPNPLVEINPEDAARLGIADGQWCRVYNHAGEAKLKAKVTQKVRPGVIHAQHGWSFPELDPNNGPDGCYSTFRSNINNLIEHFHTGKLGFGAPFKCNICNIEPLLESYDTDMQKVWDMFKREDQ